MKTLDAILKFKIEELGKTEILEWILDIEKAYDEALEQCNYELTISENDKFATMFARLHDWYSIQFSRASYYKSEVEGKLKKILREEKRKAPLAFKTEAARKRWVEENIEEYGKIDDKMPEAIGYYDYFKGKLESIKIKHYICKSLGKAGRNEYNIGSHS